MKEEKATFSLDVIEFLFRHPWLFLYPIFIIMGGVFASTSIIKLTYQTTAMLAFETPSGTVLDAKFTQKRTDLVGRILIGTNIRYIIEIAWPNVKEDTDPVRYNALREALRSKNGINIQYDRKDPRLLIISFSGTNPKVCYQAVKATVDIIYRENRNVSERELERGLVFLRKQVELYKNKLDEIDRETASIKTELKKSFPELSDDEKNLVQDLINERGAVKTVTPEETMSTVQKSVRYEEMLADLNLQLLESRNKRGSIKKRLETGVFTTPKLSPAQNAQNWEEDPFIRQYSQAIAEKQVAIATMISKGYMPEHPDLKKLNAELEDLNTLKKNRIKELERQNSEEPGDTKNSAEEELKNGLEDVEFQIETLNDKIKLIEKYQKEAASVAKPKEIELKSDKISDLTSRLKVLRSERDVNQTYYADLRRQLEGAEIKQRLQKEEAGFNIKTVEEPKMPLAPIPAQTMPKIFTGLMIAVGIGAALSYVAHSLDNSIKSSTELRALLQIPILASIDGINTPQEIRVKHLKRSIRAIVLFISPLVSYILVKSALTILSK